MTEGAPAPMSVLTVAEIEAIGRDALVQRRRDTPPAIIVGVIAAFPGLFIPGTLVWWALLGVPMFFAARVAARRRIEAARARVHNVSPQTYRAIGDAYERALAERKGDASDVARALHEDATRLLR